MRDKGEPGQCARWRKRHSKRLKRQQEVRAIPPPSPTSTPVFLLCERRCCSSALLFWRILCNRSPRHQASSIFSIIACVWKCCVRCVWRGAFEDSSRRCQWMDHWTVRLGGWVAWCLSVFCFTNPNYLSTEEIPGGCRCWDTKSSPGDVESYCQHLKSNFEVFATTDFKISPCSRLQRRICVVFPNTNYNIHFYNAFKILWMIL